MTDLPAGLREIAALREKATPGPWFADTDYASSQLWWVIDNSEVPQSIPVAEADARFLEAVGSLSPDDWQRLAEPPLDAAWQECEAALTPTRGLTLTRSVQRRLPYSAWSQDSAREAVYDETGEYVVDEPGTVHATGPSPAAALQSLAARLRARADGAEGETA